LVALPFPAKNSRLSLGAVVAVRGGIPITQESLSE
jgi:hypothetical protein